MGARVFLFLLSVISLCNATCTEARAENVEVESKSSDRVQLRNGDVIRGIIIAQEFGKHLQVLLGNTNEKRILWKEIQEVRSEWRASHSSDVVEAKNGDVFRGAVVLQEFGKRVTVRMGDGSEERVPWKNIKEIRMNLESRPSSKTDLNRSEQVAPDEAAKSSAVSLPAPTRPEGAPRSFGDRDFDSGRGTSGFQIRAGLSASDLSTDASSSSYATELDLGLRVGGAWSTNSKENGYSFEVGLEYMVRSVEFRAVKSGYRERLKVGSLVLPILNSVRFDQFSFGAGPYLALALSRRAENDEEDIEADFLIESLDYGLRAYLKYQVMQGASPFVGVGYDLGLANISKGSNEASNRSLLFDVGYSF
jgi:hypothetical protein